MTTTLARTTGLSALAPLNTRYHRAHAANAATVLPSSTWTTRPLRTYAVHCRLPYVTQPMPWPAVPTTIRDGGRRR